MSVSENQYKGDFWSSVIDILINMIFLLKYLREY
jgi:hypothetical protein